MATKKEPQPRYNKLFTLLFWDIRRGEKKWGFCWSHLPLARLTRGTYTPTLPSKQAAIDRSVEVLKEAQELKTTTIRLPCDPKRIRDLGQLQEEI